MTTTESTSQATKDPYGRLAPEYRDLARMYDAGVYRTSNGAAQAIARQLLESAGYLASRSKTEASDPTVTVPEVIASHAELLGTTALARSHTMPLHEGIR